MTTLGNGREEIEGYFSIFNSCGFTKPSLVFLFRGRRQGSVRSAFVVG
jgi:hypothetical protein